SGSIRSKWAEGLAFIPSVYTHEPPSFRSTFKRKLNRKNGRRLTKLHAAIISAVVQATDALGHDGSASPSGETPAQVWWLLFHLEMLLLAPATKRQRGGLSINQCIQQRMLDLASGNIQPLYEGAAKVSSWRNASDRPARPDNRAAQAAADSDNYRTAKARVCNVAAVAPINDSNIDAVKKLIPPPLPSLGREEPTISTHQTYHLPGDICATIRKAPRTTAGGLQCDTIDAFVDLIKCEDEAIDANLRRLFDFIYRGQVPKAVQHYFSDGYLFCFFKDPANPSKLRPIQIPSALRRLIASHVCTYGRSRFAMDLLPYNFAVGVKGGMNFVTKAFQLISERYIEEPQLRGDCPSRAIVFFDIVNMFSEMSREELLDRIGERYPEMLPLALLLYGDPGQVHFRWEDGTWRIIDVLEGLAQGCPLSGLFAALVLNEIVRPVDNMLRERAAARLASGDKGDDGHGGVTHFGGWVDDLSAGVPLEDLEFCCEEMAKAGGPRGGVFNTFKTRIQTSCDGESIHDTLRERDPELALSVARTIAKFSQRPYKGIGPATEPVELVEGNRLLGSPVGSPEFAEDFCDGVAEAAMKEAAQLTAHVPDLQTRLRLFSQCTLQKLPYLLGNDIMFQMPLGDTERFDPAHWMEWKGPLVDAINRQITGFLESLLGIDEVPALALQICQLELRSGGLGMVAPAARAAPDFCISMAQAIRQAREGFRFGRGIEPVKVHQSLADLFSLATNPTSRYLARYKELVPHIAAVACSPQTPSEERVAHFTYSLSPHSARSRLKDFCGRTKRAVLFETALRDWPDHVHHLPSILVSQTSYPLINMSRSVKTHRIQNDLFAIAIRRKLRLPVFDPAASPRCWCGQMHDCWGDHAMSCVANNKTMAHNYMRDGIAVALQAPLATAGLILATTKLEKERTGLISSNPDLKPLDMSFRP
ncbi:hypothetical protein ACHAWF_003911, partial [Thalassiosira exigua]